MQNLEGLWRFFSEAEEVANGKAGQSTLDAIPKVLDFLSGSLKMGATAH